MARTKLSPPRPMVGIRNYLTRDEARADIFQFMEGWYNCSSQSTSLYVVDWKRFC
jgi:hypothetical protein